MKHDNIDRCMIRALDGGVFPGAVLRVSVKGSCVFEKAYGVTDLQTGEKVAETTVFDLASLTKSLAGATALMILVQQGKIRLDSTIGALIPEFARNEKKGLTVCQLLCHMSGLADYKPYYEKLANLQQKEREGALKSMLLAEPLLHPPGSRVVYSDLGYMILNWLIEVLSGMYIDDFVHQEVFNPLGVRDLYYIRKDGTKDPECRYAATEVCGWRNRTLSGEVHDQNAWIMGGRAAHAGLFGTAAGVDELLAEFLAVYHNDRMSRVFHRSVLRPFLTECGSSRRTPGFDMPSAQGSSSGCYFSPSSVGHLGFTGTSFWMDLQRRITVVLLTNRIHPTSANVKIRAFRPVIHDTVMKGLIRRAS